MLPKSQAHTLREKDMAFTRKALIDSVTPDQLIIQALYSADELAKALNALAGRVRGWYCLAHPELEHDVEDNEAFLKALLDDHKKSQMGATLAEHDLKEVRALAKDCLQLFARLNSLQQYIEQMMAKHLPNATIIAGATIGARLLAQAGSLKSLAMMPANTIQLLGAEKALFRHMRNKRALPPKYGILHEHPLIQKSRVKGKTARMIADKLAIAAKVDYFKGEPIGAKLLKEIEARS
ncbi:MAG: hypothetical protein V1735_02715 [Nanoarchaeota archaeon]